MECPQEDHEVKFSAEEYELNESKPDKTLLDSKIRIQNEPIESDSGKDEEQGPAVEDDSEFRPFMMLYGFDRKNTTFCCNICTRECGSKEAFEKHQQECKIISERDILQDGDVFICLRCFKTYAVKAVCISHVHSHNKRAEIIARWKEKKADLPPGELLQCPECPKKFVMQRNLDRHVQMHTAMRTGTYKCKICGKHFRENKELINHSLVAHGKFQMAQSTANPRIPAQANKYDTLPRKASYRSRARKNWQRREWTDD